MKKINYYIVVNDKGAQRYEEVTGIIYKGTDGYSYGIENKGGLFRATDLLTGLKVCDAPLRKNCILKIEERIPVISRIRGGENYLSYKNNLLNYINKLFEENSKNYK